MPKPTPLIPLPGIQLNGNNVLPLRRQLYEQLGRAIRSGHLAPGTRLPSTRAFARELGVSRTTVEEAYQDLYAEGYLEGKVGAGTYVTQQLSKGLFHAATPPGEVTIPTETVSEHVDLSRRGRLLAANLLPPGF